MAAHVNPVSRRVHFALVMVFNAVAGLCVGCAARPELLHDGQGRSDLRQNVIAIDRDGRPHDPRKPAGLVWTEEQFEEQLRGMFAAMDAYHGTRPQGSRKRILVFVHGGLNETGDSLTAADREIDQIKYDAESGGYFPFFINWNSGLQDSYGEHLTSATQGCKQYDNPALR